jgi:hypothetical protein
MPPCGREVAELCEAAAVRGDLAVVQRGSGGYKRLDGLRDRARVRRARLKVQEQLQCGARRQQRLPAELSTQWGVREGGAECAARRLLHPKVPVPQ